MWYAYHYTYRPNDSQKVKIGKKKFQVNLNMENNDKTFTYDTWSTEMDHITYISKQKQQFNNKKIDICNFTSFATVVENKLSSFSISLWYNLQKSIERSG